MSFRQKPISHFTRLATGMLATAVLAGCAQNTSSHVNRAQDNGTGSYVTSLVLRDPMTNQPMPSRDYAVVASDTGHEPSDGQAIVLRGVTDAQGHTARIHFGKPVASYDMRVMERIGNGINGRSFVVTMPDGVRPVARQPYVILGCDGHPSYRGRTNSEGSTVYFTSDQSCVVTLQLLKN